MPNKLMGLLAGLVMLVLPSAAQQTCPQLMMLARAACSANVNTTGANGASCPDNSTTGTSCLQTWGAFAQKCPVATTAPWDFGGGKGKGNAISLAVETILRFVAAGKSPSLCNLPGFSNTCTVDYQVAMASTPNTTLNCGKNCNLSTPIGQTCKSLELKAFKPGSGSCCLNASKCDGTSIATPHNLRFAGMESLYSFASACANFKCDLVHLREAFCDQTQNPSYGKQICPMTVGFIGSAQGIQTLGQLQITFPGELVTCLGQLAQVNANKAKTVRSICADSLSKCAPPPSPLAAQITLDLDIASIGAGTTARTNFENGFKSDMATLLNINSAQIGITSVTAGSIKVNFTVAANPATDTIITVSQLSSAFSKAGVSLGGGKSTTLIGSDGKTKAAPPPPATPPSPPAASRSPRPNQKLALLTGFLPVASVLLM